MLMGYFTLFLQVSKIQCTFYSCCTSQDKPQHKCSIYSLSPSPPDSHSHCPQVSKEQCNRDMLTCVYSRATVSAQVPPTPPSGTSGSMAASRSLPRPLLAPSQCSAVRLRSPPCRRHKASWDPTPSSTPSPPPTFLMFAYMVR